MTKSPDAFRTISEVADWLGVQAHVLRFWESKFSQVKPVKRAGGRRYYRPNDMLLLGGIRRLLHEDGLTIKGVQKLLREEGISHVAALSQPLDDLTQSELDDAPDHPVIDQTPEIEEEKGVVLNFEARAEIEAAEAKPAPAPPADEAATTAEEPKKAEPAPAPVAQEVENEIAAPPEAAPPQPDDPVADVAEEIAHVAEQAASADTPEEPQADPAESGTAALPAFLRRPMGEPPATDNAPVEPEAPAAPPALKPRIIEMPPITQLDQIDAAPGLLSAAVRTKRLTPEQAQKIAPLLVRLTTLRDSMAARRRPGASD